MEKIKKLNKVVLEDLRSKLEDTLDQLGKELGVSLQMGNCSFDVDGKFAHFKLKVAIIGIDGMIETVEMADFKRCAALYGMKPTDLGRSFNYNGKTFKITGFNLRARAKALIAVNVVNGKSYKFAPSSVVHCLK